jgi:NAD(P)H-dependent FMN reductase
MPVKLQVVIASTRPGRAGKSIADWFAAICRSDARFATEVTDLAELDLPMLDEPHPASLRKYVHDHTRSWSRTVDSSEAFVFVMPEYNHGFSAPLKNAIDFLHDEWAFKPVGFVSYGGVAGGTRAVQLLKPVLMYLRMRPLAHQVVLAHHARHLTDGVFDPGEAADMACAVVLDELQRSISSSSSVTRPGAEIMASCAPSTST